MEINSSALNITGLGIHAFNNDIDYHIKLSLLELLAKKAKQAKKENETFGVVEDDGLGKINLFLSMKGNIDNPFISYDMKGMQDQFKENLQAEKQNVKALLKEEFGWFKKDSTLKLNPKKKESNGFLLNWEENNEENKKNKAPAQKQWRKVESTKKQGEEEQSAETSDDYN